MANRTYIADFEPNRLVQGVFAIQNAQLGLTKAGKPYLKCLLADKTGRTPGRMWNTSEDLVRSLPTDGFVHIEGQTQPYQGEMQVVIQNIAPAQPSAADMRDLLPSSVFDPDEMFAELTGLLDSLEHPAIKSLAKAYLDDAELMERFKQAPAAMALHHAYLSGLLEHTLNLMRLADRVLPLYPKLNRDIVMMGLFLHDLGKTVELTWANGFDYSDDGRLVGHIARGVVWLNDKARGLAEAGTPLPGDLLFVLEHIILSHHGQPEYGALKQPATPEAILIHMIDNIDAKMQMSLEAARPDRENAAVQLGGNFTEKMWALDSVRLYRPDPLAAKQPAPQAAPAKPAAPKPASKPKPQSKKKEIDPNAPLPELKLGGDSSGRGGL